jgi:hypothetical protein
LKSLHDTGSVDEEIQLSASKSYDICDPNERGQWLDVLIAMVEYLRSGESKVGYLNNSVEKNMLHKENKVIFEEGVTEEQGSREIVEGEENMAESSLEDRNPALRSRGSRRKRKVESSED